MKKQEKILNELMKIAEDVAPVSRAKICAAVVLKNEIVAYGTNQKKSHPLQRKYAKNIHACYLHAEIDAIVKASKRISPEQFKQATIYVARVKKTNEGRYVRGLAKPCPGCQSAIFAFGFKDVIFTEE